MFKRYKDERVGHWMSLGRPIAGEGESHRFDNRSWVFQHLIRSISEEGLVPELNPCTPGPTKNQKVRVFDDFWEKYWVPISEATFLVTF
jgi:hypothetical protein